MRMLEYMTGVQILEELQLPCRILWLRVLADLIMCHNITIAFFLKCKVCSTCDGMTYIKMSGRRLKKSLFYKKKVKSKNRPPKSIKNLLT